MIEDNEEATPEEVKHYILDVVSDLTSDFMYHDRKDDDVLKMGEIQKAIASGAITVDDMVERFRREIQERL